MSLRSAHLPEAIGDHQTARLFCICNAVRPGDVQTHEQLSQSRAEPEKTATVRFGENPFCAVPTLFVRYLSTTLTDR